MPSGPPHLHQRFGDDTTAWLYLFRRGFHQNRFVIALPYRGYNPKECEWDAITYLMQEWDWDFTRKAPEKSVGLPRLHRAHAWVSRVLSGPLRVRDKYLARLRMWWYCCASYEIRRRWYYLTGRRKEWEEGMKVYSDFDQSA